jgi:hypothetical protein
MRSFCLENYCNRALSKRQVLCYYFGGFPLEEASEHCFLSIKVLFWCLLSNLDKFHILCCSIVILH